MTDKEKIRPNLNLFKGQGIIVVRVFLNLAYV